MQAVGASPYASGRTFRFEREGEVPNNEGDAVSTINQIFADTNKVSGTVREKRPDGTVITAKLNKGPADMSEQAFADAAAAGGATFSQKAGQGDRVRTRTRKDVTGALASSGILELLGLTPTPATVPEPVQRRGRSAAPSANGTASS